MDSLKIFLATIGLVLELIFSLIWFYLIRIYFNIEIIGVYGALTSFFMIFSFITGLGFAVAHLKYFPTAKNEDEEAIYNGTFLFFKIIQFFSYIVIVLIFISLIPIYKADIRLIYAFFLAFSLRIGGDCLISFFLSKKQVIRRIIPLLMSDPLKIIILLTLRNFLIYNIWLIAYILILTNSIYFIGNLYFLKDYKFKRPTRQIIKNYFNYALPFFITSSLIIFTNNIDVLLIYAWFPIEDVANYYTAKQMYGWSDYILGGLVSLLVVIFSENIESGNNEKNLYLIKKIQKFLNFLIVPLIFLIALYSSILLLLIFGESYELTAIILTIFYFNLFMISIDFANMIYFRALGEVKLIAIKTIVRSILNLFLLIIFVAPFFLKMGAIGASLAIVCTNFLINIYYYLFVYKKFRLSFYWGSVRNLIIMIGIYILHLYIFELFSYPLSIQLLFGLLDLCLYFIINYICKGFSIEEFKFVLNIFNLKNIKEQIILELKEKN